MATDSVTYYECAWVTAPTAGQTITSFAAGAVPAGRYELGVEYYYAGGTLGTPETGTSGGNFQLFIGNQQIGNINDGFLNANPVLNSPAIKRFIVDLDGATSISLVANQAGSTGVKYAGAMWLEPSAITPAVL
jgi:hypothetical protein